MEWKDKQRRARLKDLRSEKDISQERPDDYQLTKTDRMNGEEVSWTFHLSSKKLVKFFK